MKKINNSIDYRYKWYVMAAVGMGIFLGTIDSSIVNITLPTMVQDFQTTFATIQWVVLSYLLTITTLMLSMGRLADMKGKKPIYTLGFVIFTLGSLFCGLSPTVHLLILARIFQGIGTAMVTSLGMAIVTESFPPEERGKALGIIGALVSIGIVTGPTLGGFIVKSLSWHWVFFVNLPIGLIGIPMVIRFVPDLRPKGDQRFDFGGAITLLLSLLSLLMALSIGQDRGFTDGLILLLFGGSLVFLLIFIYIERITPQPMIDLSLFKNKLFSTNLVTGMITFVCTTGSLILIPFYLQDDLGYDPQQAGLLMAIVPVTIGLIAPLAGSLSDRIGTRPITALGLAVMVVGFMLVSGLSLETSAVSYILRFFPLGLGIGLFQSPNNSAIMGTAPRERLGVVSGLLAITRTLGQTTGIAVLGAIWATRTFSYAGQVYPGGATDAPVIAQIAGQHDTFVLCIILTIIALALAVWALLEERQQRVHNVVPQHGK
jgi:EmrB/QacA subfamily drug resistance transporter